MQVCALTEEKRTAEEGATGNDHHALTLARRTVDDALYRLGLEQSAVGRYAIIGDDILSAERGDIHARCVMKPRIDRGAVGPQVARLGLLGKRRGEKEEGQK